MRSSCRHTTSGCASRSHSSRRSSRLRMLLMLYVTIFTARKYTCGGVPFLVGRGLRFRCSSADRSDVQFIRTLRVALLNARTMYHLAGAGRGSRRFACLAACCLTSAGVHAQSLEELGRLSIED